MIFSKASAAAFAALLLPSSSLAQTYTSCNPLQKTCPADTALGGSRNIDFTQGASAGNFDVSSSSGVSYDSTNGVALTVAKQGDAPTLSSKWYIMFGKVEVTLKSAPGTGIVSSAVLQSDDLDEIDWEWLGGDTSQVQSNYFGKGITGGYNRGAFHSNPTSQSQFNTYTIDWSSQQIVWSINGQNVRVLTPAAAGNQYPQTPMQLKVGVWAGGDPSNSPGTISWAGGQTDYSKGPYTMHVKSIVVTDYSTGSKYEYSDMSGSWQSIRAVGGSVNSGTPSGTVSSAPAVISTTSGQPSPFQGTHADSSSSYANPSVYPWVGTATTLASSAASCYTGLPSGWTCSSNGKALPPSSAPSTSPPVSSTSFPAASYSAVSSLVNSTVTTIRTNVTTITQASLTTRTSTATYTNLQFTNAAYHAPTSHQGALGGLLLGVLGLMAL